ncbi:MAG: hypothetical protein RL885_00210 [Planctomycetota bacterium]
MPKFLRNAIRVWVATVLVTLVASYFLWEWRFESDPILPSLSYEGFSELIAPDTEPNYWTYAVWVAAVLLTINALIRLVELGLVLLTQRRKRKKPRTDEE